MPQTRRISTGNPEADAILGGGFPRCSINIVMGQPGTGKSIFAEQLAFKNALLRTGGMIQPGFQSSYILALTHPTLSAQALLIRLDAMGFAVSAGSACSSGTLKKSRVLEAFGVDDETAARTIRVSLGWSTTAEDLERFAQAWTALG